MKMLNRVGMCLIISLFILVFYIFNSASLLSVSKSDTFNGWSGQDFLLNKFQRLSLPNKVWSKPKLNFTWVKYGYQDSDWALLCSSWLCVEGNGADKNGKKSLIVYSPEDFNFSEVPGNFNVTVRHTDPPKKFKFQQNTTAYFILTGANEKEIYIFNLHHFFRDFAIPFFTLKNRIDHQDRQSVFYQFATKRDPMEMIPFFESIDVKERDQYSRFDYNQVPHGTCFTQSVFADFFHRPLTPEPFKRHHDYTTEVKPLIRHMKSQFNMSKNTCIGNIFPRITIIFRIPKKGRVIRNLDLILQELHHRGFSNTEVVTLENLSLADQMRLVFCTDVLVGVHGAGMQWAVFMQEGSALVEIAWPTRGWYFYYASSGGYYFHRVLCQHSQKEHPFLTVFDGGNQFDLSLQWWSMRNTVVDICKNFQSEYYPHVRVFQVEVPAANVTFKKNYGEGVLHRGKARWGQPYVPVVPLMKAIEKAVSGAPSETPRLGLHVGPYPGWITTKA